MVHRAMAADRRRTIAGRHATIIGHGRTIGKRQTMVRQIEATVRHRVIVVLKDFAARGTALEMATSLPVHRHDRKLECCFHRLLVSI